MGADTGFPRSISIQTTSMCCASCVFCPQREVQGLFPSIVMDRGLFQTIINQCRGRGVSMINLFMNNEPLTDPYIIDRLHHARDACSRADLNVFTNGLLLTPELAYKLVCSPATWINISLHGIRESTISKAMGISSDTVLENLDDLLQAARQVRGTLDSIGVNFLRHQYLSDEEAEEAIHYWRAKGIKSISVFDGPVSRAGNVSGLPKTRHTGKIVGCLSVRADEMLHVTEDGKVILCCMDWRREVILGDLRRESIAEVWNGKRRQVWEMIRGRGDMPSGFLCRRCEEAAFSAAVDDPGAEQRDIVFVHLPPSANASMPDWARSLIGRINDHGLITSCIDLNRECRDRASTTQEGLWTNRPPRFTSWEREFHRQLEGRGAREIVKWCLDSLLAAPARTVGFVINRENLRFSLEVASRLKGHTPGVRTVFLCAGRALKPKPGYVAREAVDLVLAGGHRSRSRLVDLLTRRELRVLMIHPHDLFSPQEPWTIRVVSIARELAVMGHEVRLCYFPIAGEPAAVKNQLGPVKTIALDRSHTPTALVANTRRLVELARQADVIHFQKCHYYASLPSVLAAYIAGRPVHYDWDDNEEQIWYESVAPGIRARCVGLTYGALERLLPRLSDSVSCASARLRQMTEGRGVPAARVFDSAVGADLEMFRPGLDGRRVRKQHGVEGDLVLYVGQLHGAQYAELVIDAARVVLETRPGVTFMIVGDGYLRDQLVARARGLGLEDRVIFTGSVPHAEVPLHMAAADVCVAAFEDSEVTRCKSPLKIAEYLASGKPVVASGVGEVSTMVGEAGLVVPPGDAGALAEGIVHVLANRDLKERLGRLARARAESTFGWNHTATSIAAAYETIRC